MGRACTNKMVGALQAMVPAVLDTANCQGRVILGGAAVTTPPELNLHLRGHTPSPSTKPQLSLPPPLPFNFPQPTIQGTGLHTLPWPTYPTITNTNKTQVIIYNIHHILILSTRSTCVALLDTLACHPHQFTKTPAYPQFQSMVSRGNFFSMEIATNKA